MEVDSLVAGCVSGLLLTVSFLLAILHFYSNSYVGQWEKMGVPGPKPWPIVNNLPDLRKGLSAALDKWRTRYGKIFGVYGILSRSPTLVVMDPKLLSEILVTDFNNFADRHMMKFTQSSLTHGLFFQNGHDWKRHRLVISPMFTSAKLRLMLHHINDSAANLVSLIKETKGKGELIPLKRFASKFTSDVIAKSGFGVSANAVAKEDNEFARNIDRFFKIAPLTQRLFHLLSLYFPCAMDLGYKLFNSMDTINPEADKYFVALTEATIERKKRENENGCVSKTKDMLDILLEAEVEGEKELSQDAKYLTREEIIGNSTLLILAAFDTTSSALRSILYLLGRHPDVQEKVIEEVDRVMAGAKQPDFEQLSELKYTEQVIKETLRLYPSAISTTRQIAETRTYCGITIPKGTNIWIPIYKILKDSDYFLDPEKFDPDRFGPGRRKENEATAFIPFGYGPRFCVGKRFAMLEMKVLLCHLLTNMKFLQTERTEPKAGCNVQMETLDNFIEVPTKPIELEVVLREKD